MTDRRQWVDAKFLIQTGISLVLAVGGAMLGSYIGTQKKTAVLENAVDGVKQSVAALSSQTAGQTNEMRSQLQSLALLVNNANMKTSTDIARAQADNDARLREIEDLKRADDKLADLVKLNELRVDTVKDKLARIEGQLNIHPPQTRKE